MFRVHISALVQRDHRLLMVREEKPENHGKWNLPGGHLEEGESLVEGVVRELLEETLLSGMPTYLLGVYPTTRRTRPALRFVFAMEAEGVPEPGDQILEVGWFTPEELRALPEEQVVAPWMLTAILDDVALNRRLPLPWEAETDHAV